MAFQLQLTLPVRYQDVPLDCGSRMDVLVENQLIIELKKYREALGASRGPIADLDEIGRKEDWTLHELQRNQTEGGH